MIGWGSAAENGQRISSNPRASGSRRALVCAPLPPEYDRESGSRRIYHMIEFLREAGWSVAFVCENAPPDSRHVKHLRDRGIPTFIGFGGSTPELIECGDFDVAIFAFWYLAERHAELVERLSPRTRVVVESVDIHWLRVARQIFQDQGGSEAVLDERFGTEFARELNAYARADRVLTVSEKEASLVNDVLGRPGHAAAVPDADELSLSQFEYGAREGMLFVGNFRHPPNLDAVTYLCDEILPLVPSDIRQAHPLWIVGNGLDGRVRDAARSCDHVRLVGWVPSLEPYLHRARVSVVPLRYGAGTKRKLIQSLMAGTPAVTTPIGAEGMNLVDGEHLLVGSDAQSFADALTLLISDRSLWLDLARDGREWALSGHSPADSGRRLWEVMEEVLARPSRRVPDQEVDREDERLRFREAVASTVGEGADVLVVSRGDPELVRVPEIHCEHFPRDPDGGYAGYHPENSEAAIRHLDEIGTPGGYLAFPPSAFWWLEHYPDLAGHLERHFHTVRRDSDCILYCRESPLISSADRSREGVSVTHRMPSNKGGR